MWNRGDILDGHDVDSIGVKRPGGRLATAADAFDQHVYISKALITHPFDDIADNERGGVGR